MFESGMIKVTSDDECIIERQRRKEGQNAFLVGKWIIMLTIKGDITVDSSTRDVSAIEIRKMRGSHVLPHFSSRNLFFYSQSVCKFSDILTQVTFHLPMHSSISSMEKSAVCVVYAESYDVTDRDVKARSLGASFLEYSFFLSYLFVTSLKTKTVPLK